MGGLFLGGDCLVGKVVEFERFEMLVWLSPCHWKSASTSTNLQQNPSFCHPKENAQIGTEQLTTPKHHATEVLLGITRQLLYDVHLIVAFFDPPTTIQSGTLRMTHHQTTINSSTPNRSKSLVFSLQIKPLVRIKARGLLTLVARWRCKAPGWRFPRCHDPDSSTSGPNTMETLLKKR